MPVWSSLVSDSEKYQIFRYFIQENLVAAEDYDQKKLEELEKTLRKELDSDISLKVPLDSRLRQDVSLNPNMEVAKDFDLNLLAKKDEEEFEKLEKNYDEESPAKKTVTNTEELSDEEKERRRVQEETDEAMRLIDEVDSQLPDPEVYARMNASLPEKAMRYLAYKFPIVHSISVKIHKTLWLWPKHIYHKLADSDFRKNFWKILFSAIKSLLLFTFKKSKEASLAVLKFLKLQIGSFFKLSTKDKFKLIFALVFAGLGVYLAKFIMHHSLMPPSQEKYIEDLSSVSDASYNVDEKQKWEDFKDPMRHPEFMVQLNRLVVNLRPTDESSRNPMVLFELFIQTSTQEAAVEIKDKELEIRDLILRISESQTYNDLRSVEGKTKFKILIKRSLNKILQTGSVEQIYFKNFIYKY